MRDIIIRRSISELQREGLRFSVDEVAKSLKISKKTVYKYFASKEDLAVAIYKTFYDDAIKRIEQEESGDPRESAAALLTAYFRSHCMARREIFNKYALNGGIRSLAEDGHNKIRAYVENILPQDGREPLMIIIDGSLQKLCERGEYEAEVIDRLVTLLC